MKKRYETFTILTSKINRNVKKLKNGGMAKYHLRSAQVSCLYYLYRVGDLTSSQLCELCDEDKATISRSIASLEKEGYLYCEDQGTKRYNSAFLLTDQGKEAGAEIASKIDHVLDEVADVLSRQERDEFYRCLKLISDKLDEIADHADDLW